MIRERRALGRTRGLGLVAALVVSTASAQGPDPIAAVTTRDPMELARAVARLGDEGVIERLDAQARDVRAAAVEASPWMRGPELALAPLAAIAAGRDPELAPAAARAAARIARELDAGALATREVDPATLSEARARFAALGADATARADVRAAARVVAAQLGAAGVPDP